MRYHILTYGCQMNKSDSERIAANLEKKGYKKSSRINDADLVVVNMCSVRQSAVDKILGQYRNLAKLKAKNKKMKIILTGCILKKDKIKFRNIFDEIWEGGKNSQSFNSAELKKLSYIPISNGCNNTCTYCVVPFTRGRLICRSHKDVLKEIKNAADNGSAEIWLLGQNVNDYKSPADPAINFAKLLEMINNLPNNFKLSFTSPHPNNFSEKLINALQRCDKFSGFLNLPVQSGDDEILKKMNRNYTAKQYLELAKKLQRKIPHIKLSTDIIVGFPGETNRQFQNTVKLFKKIKFGVAFISKYSPRPGTLAAKMENNVPLTEKKKRERILRALLPAREVIPSRSLFGITSRAENQKKDG